VLLCLQIRCSPLPTSIPTSSSSVSLNEGLQLSRQKRENWESAADFATELYKRSISLSEDDSKLWREIVNSQLKPGSGFLNFNNVWNSIRRLS
jgi:ribosomal protein S10